MKGVIPMAYSSATNECQCSTCLGYGMDGEPDYYPVERARRNGTEPAQNNPAPVIGAATIGETQPVDLDDCVRF
jgi:hypothetical protein